MRRRVAPVAVSVRARSVMRRLGRTLGLAISLALAFASTSYAFGSVNEAFFDPLAFVGSGCGTTDTDYVRVDDINAYDVVSTDPPMGGKLTDANGQVVTTITDVSLESDRVTFTATGSDAACIADQSGATPSWSTSLGGEAVLRAWVPCSASRRGVQQLFNYGVSCSTARKVAYGFPYTRGRCGGFPNYYKSRTCTVRVAGRRWRCSHNLQQEGETVFFTAFHTCTASQGRRVDWQIHGRYE
jgi:hypothetical protein